MIQIFAFIMMTVFALCAAILVAISKLFGISYPEASVIVNLCMQPVLLVISSFALFVCRIKKRSGIIANLCYLILNIVAMIKLFMHYQVWNINFAFDKCVDELGFLASKITWLFPQKDPNIYPGQPDCIVEYMTVNVVIFVILYLFVLYLNRKLAKV
mgnify:CR=1 FL=1